MRTSPQSANPRLLLLPVTNYWLLILPYGTSADEKLDQITESLLLL